MAPCPTGPPGPSARTECQSSLGARRLVTALLSASWLWATASVRGQAAPAGLPVAQDHAGQLSADHTLSIPRSANGRLRFEASRSGAATLLLLGLRGGGAVSILVNGAAPLSVELLDRRTAVRNPPGVGVLGLLPPLARQAQATADSALVWAVLQSGSNEVEVLETEGIQAGRVAGTNRWFVTSSQSAGEPLFWVDLDILPTLRSEFPARVHYGPGGEGFLWFSARWDQYYGEVYGERVSRIQGTSGTAAAVLSYTVEYPRRHLVMPTQMTFTPDPLTGALTVRVHQVLRAVEDTTCGSGLEFLHIKVTDDGARDWGDGAMDYAWYRSQSGDCPDAPPGSHTGMVRVVDTTLRTYAYRSSVSDPQRTAVSDVRHTGAAVPLAAANSIGGYLTKTGVGSCGWLIHQYRASFRDDLAPVYSHCGAGADTHFYVCWAEFFNPLAMKAGDKIEAEYSLTMLPCEVSREEIEDLNEADLHIFGSAKEQSAPIAGWFGTKNAVGLQRTDGSLILLGLGRGPARVPLPAATAEKALNAYRLFALAEPTYDYLDLSQGTVEVRPGWITVIDCGAALWEPVPAPSGGGYYPPSLPLGQADEVEAEAARKPWPQPPTGGPFQGALMRK